MDLSTMRKKVNERVYKSLREYKVDLYRVFDNCTKYNSFETVYYKEATKLRKKYVQCQ